MNDSIGLVKPRRARHKAVVIRLAGFTYGFLKVLGRAGVDDRGYAAWRCRCICGQEVVASGDKLRAGFRKACGVGGHRYRNPSLAEFDKFTYTSWRGMHKRCREKSHKNYPNYGGRGIKICARWYDYRAFLADMGKRPGKEFTIERVDVNGDYEPGNCCWITADAQRRNKRNSVFVTYQGRKLLLIDLVKELGLSRNVVYQRLKLGWPLEHAIGAVLRPRHGAGRPAKVLTPLPPLPPSVSVTN